MDLFDFVLCRQSPSTSHLEACQFAVNSHTAQLCLRIVLWLEELASKSLDLERKVAIPIYTIFQYISLPFSFWHDTLLVDVVFFSNS